MPSLRDHSFPPNGNCKHVFSLAKAFSHQRSKHVCAGCTLRLQHGPRRSLRRLLCREHNLHGLQITWGFEKNIPKGLTCTFTSLKLCKDYIPYTGNNLSCKSLPPLCVFSTSTGRCLAPLLKSSDTLWLKRVRYFTYIDLLSLTSGSLHNLLNDPVTPDILSISHRSVSNTCRVHLITTSLEEETTGEMRMVLTIKHSQVQNHALLETSPLTSLTPLALNRWRHPAAWPGILGMFLSQKAKSVWTCK